MSKPKGVLESAAQVVIVIFAGVLGTIFTGSIYMPFFVPVVGYFLWKIYDKTKELESRLSKLERAPEELKPEQS